MAIDCEMNEGITKNIVCKVTIVNELGEIVLDTLIQQNESEIRKSHVSIHGIENENLEDAPHFESVREHLIQIIKDFELTISPF